jgi:hypothetical protein
MTFMDRTTPLKAASSPFHAVGVWRGRIVGVNGALVSVEVPRLSGDLVYDNVEVIHDVAAAMLRVNDHVFVSFVEGRQDDLVVVGLVRREEAPNPRWFGSFYDTTTQTNAGAAEVNVFSFDTTVVANGISIVNNTQITFAYTGTYNIQFSAQFDKTDSGDDDVEVWFSQNGSDADWSSTIMTLHGNNGRDVAAWNFVVQVTAGDYCELHWHSDDVNMRLLARAAQTTPTRPAIPSVILTVVPV